jgi:hypothetical protein
VCLSLSASSFSVGWVLTSTVRFEGWTTDTWTRFLSLWKPRAAPEREATRPRGGIVVVHENSKVRKLLHTHKGRLDPALVTAWPSPLAEIVPANLGSWGLSTQTGTLEDVMEEFGARTKREDDFLAQSLRLIGIMREKMLSGEMEFWPQRLSGVPVPNEAVVRRSLDTVCSDGKAILLGLFKEGELYTGLCARRRGYGFDVIAGPEDMRLKMGLVSGDWRRDYRHLARVAEEMYAPLSLGCFAEVDQFRALQVDPEPGAWGRAVALRNIVLSPTPTAVGVALGIDGARYAARGLRVFTSRIDKLGLLDPLLSTMRHKASTVLGDQDLSLMLGFSPMDVLRLLLKR